LWLQYCRYESSRCTRHISCIGAYGKFKMTSNSFGRLFRFTTWGESHGPAIGCVIDGVPPLIPLTEADIQIYLDKRKPGQSRFTTQRQEPDTVRILSGVFEGKTTGTSISLVIENQDQRSKDYGDIKDKFRPGHADYTYEKKYGIRDYRGGGRSSARETAMRVAAGAIAQKIISSRSLELDPVEFYINEGLLPEKKQYSYAIKLPITATSNMVGGYIYLNDSYIADLTSYKEPSFEEELEDLYNEQTNYDYGGS